MSLEEVKKKNTQQLREAWPVAQLVGASSHALKGGWFNPRLGHMPGLWVWSPVSVWSGCVQEVTYQCSSLSLSCPSSLSKINKHILR